MPQPTELSVALPVLLLPTPSTTWSAGIANTIKWSTPVANAHYIVGIQDDTGNWIWPSPEGGPLEGPVASSPMTLTVPANTLTAAASYTLTLATLNGEVQFDNHGRILVTGGTVIATAQPGSIMVYGAGMMVPITPTP